MTGRIIAAGLRARPVRTSVSILAVALEVALILSIVGLVNGMVRGSAEHMTEAGADMMLMPAKASIVIAMGDAALSETMKAGLEELHNVMGVTPVIVASSVGKSGVDNVWGIDPESYNKISGNFRFLEGALFTRSNQVVVDDLFARAKALHAGDKVQLLSDDYTISGIVEHGKGARIFMQLKALQEKKNAFGEDENGQRIGKVSFFFIKLTNPEKYAEFRTEYVDPKEDRPDEPPLLKAYNVIRVSDFLTIFSNGLPGLDEFRAIVVFISMCVGVLVIFLSTYTTITERTREIGVLRSLGATKGLIVAMVIQESLLICAGGAVIGTFASFGIARFVRVLFPTQNLEISWDWIAAAALLALLSGILGAIYPAVKAARQDPIEALAYE